MEIGLSFWLGFITAILILKTTDLINKLIRFIIREVKKR